jgi:ankyrin repeat protein
MVNAMRTDETVPLHLAAKSGNEAVVMVLLKEKANIDATNDQDETPLYKAASKGYDNICGLLISW